MPTPDDALDGRDDVAAMEISDAFVWAAVAVEEPVLLLTPRFAPLEHRGAGRLGPSYVFEKALRGLGAQRLIVPPGGITAPPGDPLPGWESTVDRAAGRVRITGPDPLGLVYDGTLGAEPTWYQLLAPDRGLVLITVATAEPTGTAVLAGIEAGHALYVRTTLTTASRSRRTR